MKEKRSILLYIAGIVIGGIGGFLYWRFIGCASGTCPISSSPLMSTLFGVLIGVSTSSMFIKKKEK